jgi:protein involved in polysaccharide export with SLBB domain
MAPKRVVRMEISMTMQTRVSKFFMVVMFAVPGVVMAQTPSPPREAAPEARGEYRIGPEDILDVAVWNNPSLSRTTPVRPDGKISLPLLNDVEAAGLTPASSGSTRRIPKSP